jgi:hypothetical protein
MLFMSSMLSIFYMFYIFYVFSIFYILYLSYLFYMLTILCEHSLDVVDRLHLMLSALLSVLMLNVFIAFKVLILLNNVEF